MRVENDDFAPSIDQSRPKLSIQSIAALSNWHKPNAIYLLIGSLLYLVGTFGVTIGFNVPLNNALAMVSDRPSAIVDPNSADGAILWAKYLTNWTFWNHVRMVAAIAASALLMWA